jgi:hypothetical protein
MVFFIPWRVVAEESGAAQFGFGGAMLLSPVEICLGTSPSQAAKSPPLENPPPDRSRQPSR